MQIPWTLTDTQVRLGLSAMKQVAAANGVFAAEERELIEAAARALGTSIDPDRLEPVTPEALADAFPDETWRHRVLQAMVATALIDGEASRDELQLIERFAKGLGVQDPWVRSLHRVIEGQLIRLRMDLGRRLPIARNLVAEMWKEEGVRGIWRIIQTFRKKGTDEPEVAWRYKQLGLLPEGTLGREYWKHMTARKFAFSGEPGGMLERQNHHDLTHVLTGYDTDAEGECQIAAFYAGYIGTEPFGFIFMVLVFFQLGIKLGPAEPTRMKFDPEKVIRAMRRGAQINTDLTDHWDYWPLMDQPIDEVRRRYNIVP
jgi:tellurite resistance protein